MIGYDPNNPFGFMQEIPSVKPEQEPTEDDITAAYIIGCLYAVAGIALFLLVVILITWLL